ncbi:restriction endonuclease [Pseudoxanthomonas sp. PXM01]|uniref:restriction endonuclease n=1 Tax=Pseudoxanthomonas sp. PXM01 TaxID=2769295 RepID=UPI001782F10C|nr:restriction endonuclease [Pseudoxanthomonas sp. PXM01]MBD9467608.1 restriction endonuclease [Pseudoxanthomonas sp. PXM01]
MSIWLIGLAVTLVSGVTATLYFWLVRRPHDEMSYGLHALSGLRWREFSKLVLAAMAERGLVEAVPEQQESREPQSTFLLARGEERWLLSCKHGSAYRIAAAPVQELAASIRLGAAQGGILATEGKVEKEGRDAAQGTSIELLDGPRLWPEVRHLVEPALLDQITHYASSRAKRHTSISWLGAVTLGALAMVAWSGTHPASDKAAAPPAPAAVVAPEVPAAPAPVAPESFQEPTEAELEAQMASVLKALSKTPGITRGVWQTRLTLSIDRVASEKEVWPWICLELERYPALRASRVQLNPPPGSSEPVRWRQCKTM